MKKILITIFLIFLLFNNLNVCAETNSNTDSKPIVLKIVASWPEGYNSNRGLVVFMEHIAISGAGKVVVKKIGGPETIPQLELAEAVRDGTIDMGWTVGG